MNAKSDIINQYSLAFIEAIDEEHLSFDKKEIVFKEIISLLQAIRNENEYIKLLNSSNIDRDIKKSLITTLLDDNQTNYIKNMIFYMLDKADQYLIVDVLNEIIQKLCEPLDYVLLKITTAYPLSKDEINKIVNKISNKLNKKVIHEIIIDNSYIAGISIEFNSKRIDNSIKTKLHEIRKNLFKVKE